MGLQRHQLGAAIYAVDRLEFGFRHHRCGANQVNCGTTGLIGLTGEVIGNSVELFATNSTLGDLDQTYLYGITDSLTATSGAGESFTTLATAAPGTNIRGVSFAPSAAPVPEPGSLPLFGVALFGMLIVRRRFRGI